MYLARFIRPGPHLQTYTTARREIGVIHDGHKFKLDKKTLTNIHWRCVTNRCPALLTTTHSYQLLGENEVHTCPPIPAEDHPSPPSSLTGAPLCPSPPSSPTEDLDVTSNVTASAQNDTATGQAKEIQKTIQTFKTRKGGCGVIYLNFQYHFKYRSNLTTPATITWTCKTKHCKASLLTTNDHRVVKFGLHEHTCESQQKTVR